MPDSAGRSLQWATVVHRSTRNGISPNADLARRSALRGKHSGFSDPRLLAVLTYLRDHLSDPERLPLAKAARIANMSAAHFSRFFRRRVGVCFRDWQCAFRTDHAKRLLLESCMHLDKVGSAVGYEVQSTFGRVFKPYAGITPRELRMFAYDHPELHDALIRTRWPKFVVQLTALGKRDASTLAVLQSLAVRLSELQ